MSTSDWRDDCAESGVEEASVREAESASASGKPSVGPVEEAEDASSASVTEDPRRNGATGPPLLADRLVKAFAHQLRNPLTYTVASLDLLRDELDLNDASAAETYEALDMGVTRLRETLSEIELLVTCEDERPARFGLTELIEGVCAALPYHIHTRRLFDRDTWVRTDRGRLAQCLFNVLASHAFTSADKSAEIHCRECGDTGRIRVRGGDPREEISMRVDFLSVIRGEPVTGDDRLALIAEVARRADTQWQFSGDDTPSESVLEIDLARPTHAD